LKSCAQPTQYTTYKRAKGRNSASAREVFQFWCAVNTQGVNNLLLLSTMCADGEVYYVLAASNREVERGRPYTHTRRHKSNAVTLYDNAVELGVINRCLIKYLDDPSLSLSLVSRRTHEVCARQNSSMNVFTQRKHS
jgi:hypothetical protein